jgi:hypothetical protein
MYRDETFPLILGVIESGSSEAAYRAPISQGRAR